MLDVAEYLYIFIAFALSLLIHYLVIHLTHQRGIFLDEHDKVQKVHDHPTPRIGGLGIFLASMFMLNDQATGGYLMLAAIPAFIAGFLEDYSGKVSPEQRLAIMFLSPVMAIVMLPDSILSQWFFTPAAGILGIVASAVLMVALVNGVNFTDGQNGLASGTVLISLLAMMIIGVQLNDKSVVYVTAIVGASILAFLIYNFPAGKIFLGDGGAYLLGFMLAAIGIIVVQRHRTEVSPFLVVALTVYPLWEVAFSTFRKLFYDHISPFTSDDYHMHQLLYRNHSRGKAYLPVLFLLPAQIVVSCFAIIFYNNTLALILITAVYVVCYVALYFYERRRKGIRGAAAGRGLHDV
ncbi:glycosyltransferase family 4 protein [Taibaiella chishuiensis]|uniref:UDP-N-acetylmuramyl pentapeptide phosphotransferase/UDP-N-acetylglucosamine-1-phosphate transferase n=1 Tax=Taibaiella chishuiensis TaxID=1434707 RepID=A0A2P8DB36_9BACT|nr:MraY family glycosyltransferase [Taibaiella chishuiensis]PSK94434.1 UDP-N-acetylmuramyl pentapeptide phosphotransferase/UDP-N-acetylglucosamine-1-phosphate transferase [Taibaiella chishuiensis]